MLNIVVTSKPCDGLLYYSYEYCAHLNSIGVSARVVIIPHRNFTQLNYIESISEKYIHCDNLVFDITYDPDDITFVLGRSMITLSYISFTQYTQPYQILLHQLFSGKVISVYSENHPIEYQSALTFYSPLHVVDLCDFEVYPSGIGEHFEKTINFSIYKPHVDNIQFKYLFLGTNDKYYATVNQEIHAYPDHGILTYAGQHVSACNNNILSPVPNLLGMFESYVYTKSTFDPAPRLMQECKYLGKKVIYLRDSAIIDGGSVYRNRPITPPNVNPILHAIKSLNKND